ncbi:MAG: hypothetical protein IJP86_02570 [Synergistaceae bacterium]|nr:hypothetical protein [Synergistaceae bacterium]
MKKILCLVCVLALCGISCAEENQPIRLGVVRFVSRTEGVTDKQAEAIGDEFSRRLANSKAITLLERYRFDEVLREHHMTQEGRIKDGEAVELGKIAGCRYILMGAVTGLETKDTERVFVGFEDTEHEVSATIDVRIIDVQTSEVIASFSETGKVSRKTGGGGIWFFDVKKGKKAGAEEAAVERAVSALCLSIREKLAGEYVRVVKSGAGGSNWPVIDAGENWGIHPGELLCVYMEGDEIRDKDGAFVGKMLTPIAVVEADNVQKELTSVKPSKKDGVRGWLQNVRKGDVVKPITEAEADNLAARKVFPGKKGRKAR